MQFKSYSRAAIAALFFMSALSGCANNTQEYQADFRLPPVESRLVASQYDEQGDVKRYSLAAFQLSSSEMDRIIAGRIDQTNSKASLKMAERRMQSVWSGDAEVYAVRGPQQIMNGVPVLIIMPKASRSIPFMPQFDWGRQDWSEALRESAAMLQVNQRNIPSHSLHFVFFERSLEQGEEQPYPDPGKEPMVEAAQWAGWPPNMITVQYRKASPGMQDHIILKPVVRGKEAWSLWPAGVSSGKPL